ncbi:flippase activity-associated protein Agl23 [Haloarchaeobius salinus]|uniref:flippase activity-associated protein Agl23 n=1 Tax=Haloarchaeobius salinus TaxID=1198298 RepID=UPI0021098904|nr:flippase activity-associated protein Agl23 [Haloarchaeobius salinus]
MTDDPTPPSSRPADAVRTDGGSSSPSTDDRDEADGRDGPAEHDEVDEPTGEDETPGESADERTDDDEWDEWTAGTVSEDTPTDEPDDEQPTGDDAATDDPEPDELAGNDDYPWSSSNRTLGALVLVAVAGLAARLVWLGERLVHQDEGRVAYWVVRYLETGAYEYRPIVHGPFLFHVDRYVFQLLGPSDFSARLPVAILGAILPLAAWLYRKHLRDTEVVALGLFLAFNPVLLYYSRFMRSDIPLVVFVAFTVGFFLRYYDERQRRYLAAGVATLALAMTTKENALLYPVCWLGAAALLLDHRLFRAPVTDDLTVWGVLVDYLDWVLPFDLRGSWNTLTAGNVNGLVDRHIDWWRTGWTAVAVAVGLVVEFFAIIVLFYAPRGGGYTKQHAAGWPGPEQAGQNIGLWNSLGQLAGGDPDMFVAVVREAIVGSWEEFTGQWASDHGNSYLSFFEHYVNVLEAAALVLCAFAVIGFVVDRYSSDGPRDLVALASYWGFVSVLGYPIATDIRAGWATTHAIIALAIPAAVGLAIVFRWGIESFTDDDPVGVALTVVVLLLVSGQVATTAVGLVYVNDQDPDNMLVQYAQSSSTDLKDSLQEVERIGREQGGPDDVDVLFYGNEYYTSNLSDDFQPPASSGYYERRTLMWYMEMYQYRANQTDGESFVYDTAITLRQVNRTNAPVVVAIGNGSNGDDAEDIHRWLIEEGYEPREFQRFATVNRTDEGLGPGTPFMIYVNESALSEPADVPAPEQSNAVGPVSTAPTDRLQTAARTVAVDDWLRRAARPARARGSPVLGA